MVSIKGIIKNGLVEPIEPIEGHEGQEVTISFVKEDLESEKIMTHTDWEQLNQFLDENQIDTGIEDLAHQHDHYLYGTPKKESYP